MEKKFSRVVTGNVRFSGNCEWLHVNVWFRDRSEMQRLIDALTELRDSVGDQPDHVHLQHYDLAPGKQIGLTEVNFFRPARDMTDLDKELIETAERELKRQVR
jgi:hypothetical protein